MESRYSEKLAHIAFGKISTEEWRKASDLTRYFLEKPASAEALYAALQGLPDLQAHIASRIGYTPSKWLLEIELEAVNLRREHQGIEKVVAGNDAYCRAAASGLMGICFSGGGIRSATFNLGILQGLAELNLLKCFDYLSSVSGGGYIHQWFAAWSKREGFESVAKQLVPLPEPDCPTSHPEPIRWLRRFSNYLTPEIGLFTADTWVIIATWLRNTLLNQIILGSGLLFLVLLPQLLPGTIWHPTSSPHLGSAEAAVLGIIIFLFLAATFYTGKNLWFFGTRPASAHGTLGQNGVQFRIILPLLASSLLVTLLFPAIYAAQFGTTWICTLGVSAALLLALSLTIVFWSEAPLWYLKSHSGKSGSESLAQFWTQDSKGFPRLRIVFVIFGMVVAALFASLCGAAWIALTDSWIDKLAIHGRWYWWRLAVVVDPPLLLIGLLIAVIILLGLLGRAFDDGRREWLARLGAWMGLYALTWIIAVGFSLFGHSAVAWFASHFRTMLGTLVAWAGTTLSGILTGKSAMTTGPKDDKAKSVFNPLEIIATVAPYIFIAGLLVMLSAVAEIVVQVAFGRTSWIESAGILLLPPAICLLFAFRVDINEFSLHAFYRNRLARCYLGASTPGRDPNPFSGFDEKDMEIPVSDLQPKNNYYGPFPIFCTALNLTFGEDLAWQERKAASFAFTPLYSGYDVAWTACKGAKSNLRFNGFTKTETYAYPDPGVHVSTAAAISGAAVSPNMGYHSNPATAFLMTVFNVRLGWWLRNPRVLNEDGTRLNLLNSKIGLHSKSKPTQNPYPSASPHISLLYLLNELLGEADDTSNFVYLTDGGHFDNMGLYELVRRRCRYIVICDSEEDANLRFEGVGMAIRKCRIDFGAEVSLDLRPLQHINGTDNSSAHCVVGTVRYPEDTGTDCPGIVVYIKSSLTGDEPGDVLNYKKENPAFPHDTTLNQWFTESQFESYRRLGHHIAYSAFEPAGPLAIGCANPGSKSTYFKNLQKIWSAFTPEMKLYWADHTTRYGDLMTKVRTDPGVPGLFNMLFTPGDGKWKTTGMDASKVAYAVAFSSELIEFMWIIFAQLSLILPESRQHPFAQGWVKIFKNWAQIDVIQDGWKKYGPAYSLGFRLFAHAQIGLDLIPDSTNQCEKPRA